MNALASTIPQEASGCLRCGESGYTTLFHATDRLYRTTEETFNIIECVSCGLIRLSPTPTMEQLERFYPDTYWWEADDSASGRLAELYREFVLNDHVRFALHAIEAPGPVLDIGCGSGSFLHALTKRGYWTAGTDVSQQAARMCWSRHEIPAVRAALPCLPWRPGVFKAATMFHVLEHVHDPVAAVMEVHELLAPGGTFIAQTPNASCWQFLLLGDRWSGLDAPRHLTNFRAEDLAELLEYCGFEVLRTKHFSLRDNPAGLATSLCPSLDPVARKVRKIQESTHAELLKNLLYMGLVVAAAPFALLEAAGSAGSTIMIEARKPGAA